MGGTQVCVLCRRNPVDARWRPFCSERCRNEDLARWAEGRYRIETDPVVIPDEDDDSLPKTEQP
jgi:endogenous inhibitor of DNA gyrase (YacG/DUF329 family)